MPVHTRLCAVLADALAACEHTIPVLTERHQEFLEELPQAPKPGRRALSPAVKREVWQRDQGVCRECGSKELLEFDHIIPVALGGSNTVRNLQLLCEPCNRRKGATLG